MTKTEEIVTGTDAQLPANNVRTRAVLARAEANGRGFINIGGQFTGHYSKCKSVVLGADSVDFFFEQNQGMLIVNMLALTDGRVLVTYTKTLDEEEIEVLQEFGNELMEKVEQRRAAAQASIEAAAAEKEAKAKEDRELLEWARTHKDLFDATVRELRELKLKKARR